DEGAVIALDGECFTDTDITFDIYDKPLAFVLPQRAVVKQAIYNDPPALKHPAKQASGAFVKKV
ncbi:MAG: hypothetical protein IKV35_03715, partial [Clostridia bacterium]|nr:hypothetical protein [Clostridia bacterium]